MDFCHRSHLIHSDMKLAQVLIKGAVVLQPQSSTSAAADRAPIPVVHVKVAGSFPLFNCCVARKTCLSLFVSKNMCRRFRRQSVFPSPQHGQQPSWNQRVLWPFAITYFSSVDKCIVAVTGLLNCSWTRLLQQLLICSVSASCWQGACLHLRP